MEELKVILKEMKAMEERLNNKINSNFEELKEDVKETKEDIKYMKEDIKGTKEDIKNMKAGQEESYKILKGLEHSSEIHKAEIDKLNAKVNKLDVKIDNVEEKLAEKIDKPDAKIYDASSKIAEEVSERVQNILDEKFESLADDIKDIEIKTDVNTREILKLKQRLKA